MLFTILPIVLLNMPIKGFVVNLKKRPDRLARFQEKVAQHLPSINIEVVDAVDGSLLDIHDAEWKRRVNPWAYNCLGSILPGVMGCCLSHLEIMKKIMEGDDEHVIVFEDDCFFLEGRQIDADDRIRHLMETLPSQ